MSYRSPNRDRMTLQNNEIFRHAGSTATWRQYVSGSAGASIAGFGSAYHYREQTITAMFGQNMVAQIGERQVPGGMIAGGGISVVTKERLGRKDELRWMGSIYRVEGEPIPSQLVGHWVTILKRAGA